MSRLYDQPWNKGRAVGARRALSAPEVKRVRAHLVNKPHDLCLFMVALDSMLRASDLLRLTVGDLCRADGTIYQSFPLRQKKTAQPVFPVLTKSTQETLAHWIVESEKRSADFIFTRDKDPHGPPITIGFYRTLIKGWVSAVGIEPKNISAHSLRRSKAIYLYQQGTSVELIGRLLGHRSSASTIRYLGIDEAQARNKALMHDIFNPTPQSKQRANLADQIWDRLAPKLDEYLKKHGE